MKRVDWLFLGKLPNKHFRYPCSEVVTVKLEMQPRIRLWTPPLNEYRRALTADEFRKALDAIDQQIVSR